MIFVSLLVFLIKLVFFRKLCFIFSAGYGLENRTGLDRLRIGLNQKVYSNKWIEYVLNYFCLVLRSISIKNDLINSI
jgi:hypothetical protein